MRHKHTGSSGKWTGRVERCVFKLINVFYISESPRMCWKNLWWFIGNIPTVSCSSSISKTTTSNLSHRVENWTAGKLICIDLFDRGPNEDSRSTLPKPAVPNDFYATPRFFLPLSPPWAFFPFQINSSNTFLLISASLWATFFNVLHPMTETSVFSK